MQHKLSTTCTLLPTLLVGMFVLLVFFIGNKPTSDLHFAILSIDTSDFKLSNSELEDSHMPHDIYMIYSRSYCKANFVDNHTPHRPGARFGWQMKDMECRDHERYWRPGQFIASDFITEHPTNNSRFPSELSNHLDGSFRLKMTASDRLWIAALVILFILLACSLSLLGFGDIFAPFGFAIITTILLLLVMTTASSLRRGAQNNALDMVDSCEGCESVFAYYNDIGMTSGLFFLLYMFWAVLLVSWCVVVASCR
ncbi:hypothetical protein MFRU_037g00240 [Monilinia fructicola]|nr:hypothetical protein MFRU_037g00240 [Monilinia fructicola]